MIGMRIAEELQLPARDPVRPLLRPAAQGRGLLGERGADGGAVRRRRPGRKRTSKLVDWSSPLRRSYGRAHRRPRRHAARPSRHLKGIGTRATSRGVHGGALRPRRRDRAHALPLGGDGGGDPHASTSTGTAAACPTACAARRSHCSRASSASPRRPRSSTPPAASGRRARWSQAPPRPLVRPGARRRLPGVSRDTAFWRTLAEPDVPGWEPRRPAAGRRRRPPRPDRRGVRPRHRRQVAVHRAPLRARRELAVGSATGSASTPTTRRDLRRAGLLHDVGKLAISNLILDKPGKLTDAEFTLVQEHPGYSLEILGRAPASPRSPSWRPTTTSGSTARATRAGSATTSSTWRCARWPWPTSYEALTADRPYRGPLPVEKALDIVAWEVPGRLDRAAFSALERHLGRSTEPLPPGVLTIAPAPAPAPSPAPSRVKRPVT